MPMNAWVGTARGGDMGKPLNGQILTRLVTSAMLLGTLLLSSIASAERGSHITLDEPLPQPEWALPVIANGEGILTGQCWQLRA